MKKGVPISSYERAAGPELASIAHALSGAISSMFALAALYPMDTVKTKIQAQTEMVTGEAKQSMLQVIWRTYQREGLGPLMAGLDAGLINTFANSWIYFFVYARLQSLYKSLNNEANPTVAAALLIGAIAAAVNQIFTLPLATVHTRMQTHQKGSDSNSASSSRLAVEITPSMHQVALDIIHNEGVSSLWSGLDSALILVCNPSITYMVFEQLKEYTLKLRADKKLSSLEGFSLGAVAKAVATVVTYPLILAKVRMMSKKSPAGSSHSMAGGAGSPVLAASSPTAAAQKNNMIATLTMIYNKDGLRGMYVGMRSQLLKATLSSALIFMMRENFDDIAFRLTFVLSGLPLPVAAD